MVWLVDAAYRGDYRVFVRFNDGKESEIDLENYIKSKNEETVFAPLKELDVFQTVRYDSDLDTIVWANGADIAPERLYEMAC